MCAVAAAVLVQQTRAASPAAVSGLADPCALRPCVALVSAEAFTPTRGLQIIYISYRAAAESCKLYPPAHSNYVRRITIMRATAGRPELTPITSAVRDMAVFQSSVAMSAYFPIMCP